MVNYEDERKELDRATVLYDRQRLAALADEYGNAVEIKEAIKTTAAVYEIRTAQEYWFGGAPDHRTSDRVWETCQAVDEGMYTVEDGEVVPA